MKRTLALLITLLWGSASSAQLGAITFPATGKPEARPAFLRGVGALHSFWYEEAAEAFREAQKADPDFALAYWGEAMSFNHPIWLEVDLERGRKALSGLGATRDERLLKAKSARERGFLQAAEALYGEGEKQARDLAYAEAMERLGRANPTDVEVLSFRALAILGLMRQGESDARKQMQAAAILEPLYTSHPDHPGVLHYLIHAYDDPVHAPLGLRAARRYAQVAPAAFHALHMPSHIFLQLGMWPEAVASNEHSYAVSKRWVEAKKLPRSKRDLHSLQWLQYGYLQQGRFDEAKKLLDEIVPKEGEEGRERTARANMQARYAIESGDWSLLPGGVVVADTNEENDHASCATTSALTGSSPLVFASGLAAVSRGDWKTAKERLAELQTIHKTKSGVDAQTVEVLHLELEAMLEAGQGQMPRALELAAGAVSIEETLGAPSGPPETLKPANELYGELLVKAGRMTDAAEQFRISLQRTPNRRISLQGSRRAGAGDEVVTGGMVTIDGSRAAP